MAVEVRIPSLGESVSDGTIIRWAKHEGESVRADEVLLELETDKAAMEIPAPGSGVLHIVKREGERVAVGELVARIDEDGARSSVPPPEPRQSIAAPRDVPPATPNLEAASEQETIAPPSRAVGPLSPAVRRLLAEHDLDPSDIPATGKGGRL